MYHKIEDIEKWSNASKRFYKEKIEIFIKTVDVVSKKETIKTPDYNECYAITILIEFGFIQTKEDINRLKKIIKKDTLCDLLQSAMLVFANRLVFQPYLCKLSEKYRNETQKAEEQKSKIRLVDLFCGAGGLSLGFLQEGCKVIFANDIDELCIETYKYNHPEISENRIKCGDLREIVNNIERYITNDVDILIGGPPCQGFSSANKHHRVINDPRNELYKYYIKAVEKLAPKVVVMENVKGMLKVVNQVVEDYETICITKGKNQFHYSISYRLLSSSDFSVAQNRERLIYIAIRDDVVKKTNITPDFVFNAIEQANKNNTLYYLSSALEGLRELEPPEIMGVGEIDTEESGRKIDVNLFTGLENEYLKLINNNNPIPLVYNHKARYCSPINHEIYRRLNPGDDATDPKIADIMPYAHRNDKFKDKYFKLYPDRPCRTITAHLRSDCHSHIHPYEARTLTPREAARVQSFPDDYFFLGPYLKTYIQIGNAVPPLMARGIAKVLLNLLDGELNEDR